MAYVQQGKTVKISATSKATVQFQNNYYSFAYSEERELPEDDSRVDLEKERELLWETLNSEVDKQLAEIEELYKNRK